MRSARQANTTCELTTGHLVDGQYPCFSSDIGYWASCAAPFQWIQFRLPLEQCIRRVQLWPRCNTNDAVCCSDEMQGAYAQVLTSDGWETCGGQAPDVGQEGKWAMNCALTGSVIRISRDADAVFSLAEVEIFGERQQVPCSVLLLHRLPPGHGDSGRSRG